MTRNFPKVKFFFKNNLKKILKNKKTQKSGILYKQKNQISETAKTAKPHKTHKNDLV